MGLKPLKKKPFLLLESLVALFLSGMLLLVCIKALTNSYLCENKIQETLNQVNPRQCTHKTLYSIFKRSDTNSFKISKDRQTLTFTFDSVIDTDLSFAGKLGGLLTIERNKGLVLHMQKEKSNKKRIVYLNEAYTKLNLSLDEQNILTLDVLNQKNKNEQFVYFLKEKEKNHV